MFIELYISSGCYYFLILLSKNFRIPLFPIPSTFLKIKSTMIPNRKNMKKKVKSKYYSACKNMSICDFFLFFYILLFQWPHFAISSLLVSPHAQWAWKEIFNLFSSILNSQGTILCWILKDAWVKKNELCQISLLWTESYIFPISIHQTKQKDRMICHFLFWNV